MQSIIRSSPPSIVSSLPPLFFVIGHSSFDICNTRQLPYLRIDQFSHGYSRDAPHVRFFRKTIPRHIPHRQRQSRHHRNRRPTQNASKRHHQQHRPRNKPHNRPLFQRHNHPQPRNQRHRHQTPRHQHQKHSHHPHRHRQSPQPLRPAQYFLINRRPCPLLPFFRLGLRPQISRHRQLHRLFRLLRRGRHKPSHRPNQNIVIQNPLLRLRLIARIDDNGHLPPRLLIRTMNEKLHRCSSQLLFPHPCIAAVYHPA